MRQRPLLWRVSGSQESYCVARLATAAARRARGVVLAPDYSSPRRLSAAYPPTGRGSGPAQGTSSRGEGLHPTWATSGGPEYAALCDTRLHPCTGCPPTARLRAKPLDRRWGAKPRPLTSPPPPAGLDPHPASPQTASLVQARRVASAQSASGGAWFVPATAPLQAWFHNQHPRKLPPCSGRQVGCGLAAPGPRVLN